MQGSFAAAKCDVESGQSVSLSVWHPLLYQLLLGFLRGKAATAQDTTADKIRHEVCLLTSSSCPIQQGEQLHGKLSEGWFGIQCVQKGPETGPAVDAGGLHFVPAQLLAHLSPELLKGWGNV